MSSFTSPLHVEPLDGRLWRLLSPFVYHVGAYPSKEKIFIPVGFITDFASVPRLLWSIIPPWGTYGKPSIVHDYLLTQTKYTRKRADEIFLEGMEVLGVPRWKRTIMFVSVRLWGMITEKL